jgi:hypothetical protein
MNTAVLKPGVNRRLASLLLPLSLVACGGSGGGDSTGSCSVADQQAWLSGYMSDWYFWTDLSPHPEPVGFSSVASYYAALLYTGGNTAFPADRWSYVQSSDAFNRFFGDGATLGYGLSVAGLELARNAALPLYVRHVEAASPAAMQGVQRGDQVMSINERSVATLIAADDFSALTPAQAGDVLRLVLRRGGVDRSVALTAAVFNLSPVGGAAVQTTGTGRKLGYVAVKDMVSQALAPFDSAMAGFQAAGVQDLVLDLRYNGGGLVSTGATLSSYLAGARGTGLNYATLKFNSAHQSSNSNYRFSNPGAALSLPRVIVLMGRRTCSASEQVINGLRGAGVQVVAIGETSCGKPVGFQPTAYCGQTYSAVNFESVNHLGAGRYFNGFTPTCAVAEDFTVPQGSTSDPLMAAARTVADTGNCPATASGQLSPLAARASGDVPRVRPLDEGDPRPGMIPR